jgi:hypothetical protein
MKLFLTFSFMFMFNTVWASKYVSNFETDYCTNYKEGTMHFWAEGNKQNRYDSDVAFKSCIELTGYPHIAPLKYAVVRVGSYSPIKYSNKKWNHGLKGRASYASLTLKDIESIENELSSESYDHILLEIKNHFINTLRSRLD